MKNWGELFVLPAAFCLVLAGCDNQAADASSSADVPMDNISDASIDVPSPCGQAATYQTIKEIVFDTAVRSISGDTVGLNDLRRNVAVNMRLPLVTGEDYALQRTDCSGRLVLGIPLAARDAFGGDVELQADVTYSIQPAADASGDVVTVDGIQYVVQRLVVADTLRARTAIAQNGGPQLSQTYNPSFDCGQRLTNVERMICQNEDLAAMDRELDAVFTQQRDKLRGADREAFMGRQRELLRLRAACPDTQCIYDWYGTQLGSDF